MNRKDMAFWAIITFILALGMYLIFFIQSQSYQCISNPIKYSFLPLEKENDGNISCSCNIFGKDLGVLTLTHDGFKQVLPNRNPILNLSTNYIK